MSSLFNNLSNDTAHSNVKEIETSGFPNMLNTYRESVVNNYNKYNTPLNDSIAKIAKENNLNDNQIQRIVEEVNNQVYLAKYAKVKQYPDRDIVFDLASLQEIKKVDTDTAKSASAEPSSIEKKASWSDGDTLNFLNCSTHETCSLRADKLMDMKAYSAKKLAEEASDIDTQYKTAVSVLGENIYTIAEALIKYDRSYKDSQAIFNTICKEGNVNKCYQSLIKKAIDQKSSQMIEVRLLPDNYNLDIGLVDINQEDKYSLGKYSFLKSAKESASNTAIHPIVTDNGQVIKSVQTLINMAKKIEKQKSAVNELGDKKKNISARISKAKLDTVANM